MMCMLVDVTWKVLMVFLQLICFIIETVFQAIFSNTILQKKKESRNPIKDKETVKGKRLVFKNYVDQITNIGITNIRITNI